MRPITVNIQIQFDTPDSKVTKDHVYSVMDRINEVLGREFPDIYPQILTGGFDMSDVSSEGLSKGETIEKIKEIIAETGTFTMADLNDQTDGQSEDLVIIAGKNTSILIEFFGTQGVGATEYVNEMEVSNTSYKYEELSEELLYDILEYVELYKHLTE